jgi:formate dehydrogenase assembly factor FdhD
MSKIPPPVIGEALYQRLSELCEATRAVATKGRNYHAAALYIVLEALRAQAEHTGTHVAVYIQPVKP